MKEDQKAKRSIEELAEGYYKHLDSVCGLSRDTCESNTRVAKQFLAHTFRGKTVDLEQLRPADLIGFTAFRSRHCQPKTTQGIATALRSFLRFLQFRGLCDAKLVGVVPTVPINGREGIPKGLADDQLRQLLASFDRQEPIGLRDYAIALCLGELGLRAGEVARLSLDDLDWRNGVVQVVAGKTSRSSLLPLTRSVGCAIVDYLRKGRGVTRERRLFIRLSGAPMQSGDVGQAMHQAFDRAGIDVPYKGAHILRHTAATRMLRHGASLKEIADVLRHRALQTTTIYAKVDLAALSEVAMAWQEHRGEVCQQPTGEPDAAQEEMVRAVLVAVKSAWSGVQP